MGNCCGTNDKVDYSKLPMKPLVKIQSAMRTHLAKKKLKETRDKKIMTLFSKHITFCYIFIMCFF